MLAFDFSQKVDALIQCALSMILKKKKNVLMPHTVALLVFRLFRLDAFP